MVRIFKDKKTGDFVVQTTCLDHEAFISDLAEALPQVIDKSKDDAAALDTLGVLQKAMPIAFKLAGYKAENVSEQRTLVCGNAMPSSSDVVATAGR